MSLEGLIDALERYNAGVQIVALGRFRNVGNRGSKKSRCFVTKRCHIEQPQQYQELPDIDPRRSVQDAFRWLELALPFTESGWQLKKSRWKGRPRRKGAFQALNNPRGAQAPGARSASRTGARARRAEARPRRRIS
jgi:hypothetical protein